MNFDGLIPVIQCRYIEKTLAFYQSAFRYTVISKTQSANGLSWAFIQSDNTRLMLQKTPPAAPEQQDEQQGKQQATGNFTLHYYTSDVAAQHQFMTARGFLVGELHNTPYHIRQFSIIDPEGNRLTVGQDMQSTS